MASYNPMVVTTEHRMDPEEFLWNIEHDPQSFTSGRRNDDIVNWVLAKIMIMQDNGQSNIDILKEWRDFEVTLNYTQSACLYEYNTTHYQSVETKVQDCYDRYYESDPTCYLIYQGGYAQTYDATKAQEQKKEGK